MSININGQAKVTFTSTIVGDHATMTVNQLADARTQLDELAEAVRAHRHELSDEVVRQAEAARAELSAPEPRSDHVAAALKRIRDGAASVSAVAAAATAVLRTLGMA